MQPDPGSDPILTGESVATLRDSSPELKAGHESGMPGGRCMAIGYREAPACISRHSGKSCAIS